MNNFITDADGLRKLLMNNSETVTKRFSCNYRPQRSWAKVIFSQACVKNSVHRGGVCLISACWDIPPRSRPPQTRQSLSPPTRQTPPLDQADTPADQADTPQDLADTPQTRQTPPGPGRHPPGKLTPEYGLRVAGTHPTGMHSCWNLNFHWYTELN